MKVLVEMNYPDSTDISEEFVDGDKFEEVKDFEELYQLLKDVNNEDLLNHVHLEFRDDNNDFVGKITILLKDTPSFHTVTHLEEY